MPLGSSYYCILRLPVKIPSLLSAFSAVDQRRIDHRFRAELSPHIQGLRGALRVDWARIWFSITACPPRIPVATMKVHLTCSGVDMHALMLRDACEQQEHFRVPSRRASDQFGRRLQLCRSLRKETCTATKQDLDSATNHPL